MPNTKILKKTFLTKKVLSLTEIKKTIGSSSRITALRKCKRLEVVSSYSHAGSYYTLPNIPEYDQNGIWSCNSIWFSSKKTLLETICCLIMKSEDGYFSHELDKLVHVRTGDALTKLFKNKRLERSRISTRYLYTWSSHTSAQLKKRKSKLSVKVVYGYESKDRITSLKLFISILNEKQKRLFLGFESLKHGVGGDYAIAALTGVNRDTIRKGRKELEAENISAERVRGIGGGRKGLKKKRS